jgi:hypothetical protein
MRLTPLMSLSLFWLRGCAWVGDRCWDMGFEQLRLADSVVITTNHAKAPRTITDTAIVSQLVAFALDHESGWVAPWYGVPIGRIRANFYQKGTFLGDLAVGENFLVAQGCGYFYSRPVSRADRVKLLALFDVPDPAASNGRNHGWDSFGGGLTRACSRQARPLGAPLGRRVPVKEIERSDCAGGQRAACS